MLEQLPFLLVLEHILFKGLVLVWNCLSSCAPIYLKEHCVLLSSLPDHHSLQLAAHSCSWQHTAAIGSCSSDPQLPGCWPWNYSATIRQAILSLSPLLFLNCV